MRKVLLFLLTSLVAATMACGRAAEQASPPSAVPSASASASSTASPSTSPTAIPSPTPPQPAPTPATRQVFFSALPAGRYITHLHSICSGAQNFHITVLQTLVIAAGGTGSISVSSAYFGRGLCVIVYANASLSRVLTTRRI